ncbi:hypothetical protein CRE_05130 [Caenorhabditis remanei]|uniref:Uncharacterized protein n=1 Tax=Caenorhabditis remanei TaxID=31234 RepID=E3N6D4_CAERE|nr:hypothetical protein CRE_05130 [Caenorhabditis remanei]
MVTIAKAHCGSNLTVFQRIDYDKVDRLIRSDSRNKILVRRDGKSKETKSRVNKKQKYCEREAELE